MNTKPWTEQQFKERTGDAPEDDDLERTNCSLAGTPGHWSCGVCAEHNLPIHKCEPCFFKCHGNTELKRA
jgi:hypothetical protein